MAGSYSDFEAPYAGFWFFEDAWRLGSHSQLFRSWRMLKVLPPAQQLGTQQAALVVTLKNHYIGWVCHHLRIETLPPKQTTLDSVT